MNQDSQQESIIIDSKLAQQKRTRKVINTKSSQEIQDKNLYQEKEED